MIQNIKVDTIYYLTNSDFEMEFNLCGCCKMRLLTDKAENAKNFVGLLARAVSRSQVIICCGKLFEEDGIINVISHATKKPLKKINNSDYGIVDSSEISIIEGSVPLVNGDGCFCGLIAESGPQSIIMLTENKSIRKTVMKSLIHPYIEELCLIMHKSTEENTAEEVSAETEETLPIVEEIIDTENTDALDTDIEASQTDIPSEEISETEEETETEEASETVEETVTEGEESTDGTIETEEAETEAETEPTEETELPEVIISTPEEYEEAEEDFVDPVDINSGFGLYLEPERVKYKKESHYSLDYTPSEQDNAFISESDDDFLYEEERKFLSLPILIVVIILLLALAVLAYMLVLVPLRSDYVFSEFIRHIFSVSVKFI